MSSHKTGHPLQDDVRELAEGREAMRREEVASDGPLEIVFKQYLELRVDARIEFVRSLLDDGFITREDARRLLEKPGGDPPESR